MIGVTELITQNEEAYCATAIRLAHDLHWRRQISARIATGKQSIYRDRNPIVALEEFFAQSVAGAAKIAVSGR